MTTAKGVRLDGHIRIIGADSGRVLESMPLFTDSEGKRKSLERRYELALMTAELALKNSDEPIIAMEQQIIYPDRIMEGADSA